VKVLVLNGPNLNLLGTRDPGQYGSATLAELEAAMHEIGGELGVEVECVQSNHEGDLVDRIQGAGGFAGIVLNPGGYTHTSVAIRDAVEACPVPVIEVHLSNLHAREAFRQRCVIAGAARGQITGLGVDGYRAALRVLCQSGA